MDQKWIQLLGILMFFGQRITSGAGEVITAKEGRQVRIECKPQGTGTMIVWFRLLDASGMEFMASFSNGGILKSSVTSFSSIFSDSRVREGVLILQSFSKTRDSGAYSCASLKGSELLFGNITRVVGEKVEVAVGPQATTTVQNLSTTATPCVCDNIKTDKQEETSPEIFCSSIILGPLAGGCGLFLLLLIVTTMYCNHIRTRRCPHHYKRKPRVVAPGKQMMTNRHI